MGRDVYIMDNRGWLHNLTTLRFAVSVEFGRLRVNSGTEAREDDRDTDKCREDGLYKEARSPGVNPGFLVSL